MIFSKSSIIINEDSEAFTALHKTFFVLGVARGGTSAVAGSLRNLGMNMGVKSRELERFCEDEDFEFLNAKKTSGKRDFEKYFRGRSEVENTWGLKFLNPTFAHPKTLTAIENKDIYNDTSLRYLHFIIVVRDLLSSFLGECKASSKGFDNLEEPFHDYWDTYFHYYDHFKYLISHERKYPIMFVSYEKMILNPEDYMDSLVSFINKEEYTTEYRKNTEELVNFIKPVSEVYWEGLECPLK